MSIKSEDGKIEMTLSAPSDKTFLGGIQVVTNTIKGKATTPCISIPKAEIDSVMGNDIQVISFTNDKSIEVGKEN